MEDSEIVRLFFDRDEAALREVSQKYGKYCKTVALNILGDHVEAEQCVNDTYFRAWESIPPQRPLSLGAFLCRITKHLALDRIRAAGRQKRGGGNDLSFDELSEFVSGKYSLEADVERAELAAAVNTFLSSLPDKKRRLFVGRYWGQFSLSALSEMFGMSESGVSLCLTRIRNKLKAHLKKEGFDL